MADSGARNSGTNWRDELNDNRADFGPRDADVDGGCGAAEEREKRERGGVVAPACPGPSQAHPSVNNSRKTAAVTVGVRKHTQTNKKATIHKKEREREKQVSE